MNREQWNCNGNTFYSCSVGQDCTSNGMFPKGGREVSVSPEIFQRGQHYSGGVQQKAYQVPSGTNKMSYKHEHRVGCVPWYQDVNLFRGKTKFNEVNN